MIISFYYYLRIIKAMFVDANDRPIPKLETSFFTKGVALYLRSRYCCHWPCKRGYAYIHSLLK